MRLFRGNRLFLAPFAPFPIRSGGHTRIANLVEQAAARQPVYWASLQPDEQVDPIPWLAADPILVPAPSSTSLRERLTRAAVDAPKTAERAWSLLRGEPRDAARMRFPALKDQLRRLSTHTYVETIQIEYGAMGVYMPKLRWLWPQAPIVLDELEIMSVALERRLQALGPNPQVERDLARWKRFERRIWTEADVVLTVSAEEAAVVDDTVGTPKARIVPNGVDLGFFRFEERRPSKTLIFLGNLAHSPNAIGLDRFLREVWPEVSLRNPGVGLEIVGDGASPALLRYADQNVRFIGFVDDVRDSMARAALMVVPIVSGGGTRLKVLEAMAAGVPVVSTPLGCEGLGVRDGEHVVLAELDKPFADAVVRALEQFAEARRIAANARRHVEAHFSWDAVGERLE